MTDLIEVTTTLPSQADAQKLARLLVEQRLVGCVQIHGPILSVFRWQNEIHEDAEWRCTFKSMAGLQSEIVEAIEANHPYDVPEILVTAVSAASTNYGDWLRQQVGSQQ